MEEETTNEKKCPKCGSVNVEFQGVSHSQVGARPEGGQVPAANIHNFKCRDCNEIFLYVGDNP